MIRIIVVRLPYILENPSKISRYTENTQEHNIHPAAAKTLGKSRSTIANTLRVLNLDERVQEMIESGQISEGHARTLASIESPAKQYKLALDIINMDLSVRDAENYAKSKKEGKEFKKPAPKKGKLEVICKDLENEMKRVLGTKVTLNAATKSRGKIIIEYFSAEELERILEIMGIEN